MFSKVKCPKCGAKNSKERMVCIECGTALASEQVERQLPQVSTETEVPDKTVIEDELEERIEDEYRDNEKVLFKTRGKLLGKKPEEVDCIVTPSHVIIEATEPIKIPLSHIRDCELTEGGVFYPDSTATLKYLDETNKKRKLSLKMATVAFGNFKRELAKHVEFPKGFLDKVIEEFRDHTRDDFCAGLQSLGIDAEVAERGRPEEDIVESSVYDMLSVKSLGLIDIPDGPIRWVNIRKRSGNPQGIPTDYYTDYGVPDPRLRPNSPNARIITDRAKNFPLVGNVVDLRWKGGDSYPGIISRLSSDISIREPIMRSVDVTIRARGDSGCWIISTDWHPPPIQTIFSPPSSLPSLQELWNCYQSIAQHLLAEWSPSK